MCFSPKKQIKRKERGKRWRWAAMLKIRGLSLLKGHSRYFASHIKKIYIYKKVDYCIKSCVMYCARQMIQSWWTTEGYWFSTRFGTIYSLFSSYLALANAASVQALPGTGKILPRVQLICAEERFQWPVSVGANSCGWEYLRPPKYTSTCLTLPSPKQPHKPSAALPECYTHNI